MKYISSALFILILSGSAYSQAVENLFKQNIDVHIDLIPLAFPDPSVRFGSEMMLGNRWSVGLNLGVGTKAFGNRGILFSEPRWKRGYQMFEIRPEIKFYWMKRQRMGWYMAAEGLLSTMKGSAGKNYHFVEDNDTLQVNFDQADFQKTKIGMIGKLGGRFLLGERITLDFFTGLGLSNTSSSYTNYVNQTFSRSDPFFEGENYNVGKRITGHLSFGLRIGMVIWSKNQD
jgi:hypothetical protein